MFFFVFFVFWSWIGFGQAPTPVDTTLPLFNSPLSCDAFCCTRMYSLHFLHLFQAVFAECVTGARDTTYAGVSILEITT